MEPNKNTINKIIFSGQVLRSGQEPTIDWFYNLMKYYPQKVTGLPAYALIDCHYKNSSFENYIPFDVTKFFEFYGYKNYNELNSSDKTNIWVKMFYNNEYNEKAYEYVYSIFKDSLVIVHELSQIIINILEYYNIPYVDLNTDPIRFLDDQLFAFRTNYEDVYSKLLKYRIDEEFFYMNANYISAKYKTTINETKENIVLFLGQSDSDKSLIDTATGKTYSILDHKESFKKAIEGFDKIYYKRHPFVVNDEDILDYIKSLGNIEIVDENFYKLMFRRDIKKVVSISSGACIEAKYFDKSTEILLRDSIKLQYGNNFDKEAYISIYQDFFSLNFWADILSPIAKTQFFSERINFYGEKNKLRNSRPGRCYWGYEDIEQAMTVDLAISELKKTNSKSFKLKLLRTIYALTKNKKIKRQILEFKKHN